MDAHPGDAMPIDLRKMGTGIATNEQNDRAAQSMPILTNISSEKTISALKP